jgi:hypothetical protein
LDRAALLQPATAWPGDEAPAPPSPPAEEDDDIPAPVADDDAEAPADEAIADDEEDETPLPPGAVSSRFLGVSWDKSSKKWRAYYKDAERKNHHVGLYDDEEVAARARDKAITDPGLADKRDTNAVDASGALVPRERTIRRDRSAVVAPTDTSSKFWGVRWDKKSRQWKAQYRDTNYKTLHLGYFDTQEAAAHAVNDAITDAKLEGQRHTNPVVDGRLVPKASSARGPVKKRSRKEPAAAAPPTRACRQKRAVNYAEDPDFEPLATDSD